MLKIGFYFLPFLTIDPNTLIFFLITTAVIVLFFAFLIIYFTYRLVLNKSNTPLFPRNPDWEKMDFRKGEDFFRIAVNHSRLPFVRE